MRKCHSFTLFETQNICSGLPPSSGKSRELQLYVSVETNVMTCGTDFIQICAGLLLLWLAVISLFPIHKSLTKKVTDEGNAA